MWEYRVNQGILHKNFIISLLRAYNKKEKAPIVNYKNIRKTFRKPKKMKGDCEVLWIKTYKYF